MSIKGTFSLTGSDATSLRHALLLPILDHALDKFVYDPSTCEIRNITHALPEIVLLPIPPS